MNVNGQGAELLTFARSLLKDHDNISDPSVLSTQDLNTHQDESLYQTPHIDARVIARAAEAGISLAREIILDAAEAIGIGLVNLIHLFNPEMIILGGGVTQMGPLLMEPSLRIVEEHAMQMPRKAVRIVQAQLGPDVGLVGAGALIHYNVERNKLLRREEAFARERPQSPPTRATSPSAPRSLP